MTSQAARRGVDATRSGAPAVLDALDRRLIDRLQDGIPLVSRPFEALAAELGVDEVRIVERLSALLSRGVLSRFGPMYNADALGGAFTLVAMAVPEDRFDELADWLAARPEVAHNYRREHRYNMWFVLGAERAERIDAFLAEIEAVFGIRPLNLPKLDEYFLRLRFDLGEDG